MVVSIEVPDKAAELLREAYGENLGEVALDAIVTDGYRSGTLSRFQVQRILGFETSWEADEWLGAHGVNVAYSQADLEADRQTLDRVLGPGGNAD